MAFADNLRQLPAITHIAALHLLDDSGAVVATIPNAPGKAGSVTVYNALAAKHGSINVAAAEEGLQIFAEHTEDARPARRAPQYRPPARGDCHRQGLHRADRPGLIAQQTGCCQPVAHAPAGGPQPAGASSAPQRLARPVHIRCLRQWCTAAAPPRVQRMTTSTASNTAATAAAGATASPLPALRHFRWTLKDHIAHLQLNCPDSLNTMSPGFWRELDAVLHHLQHSPEAQTARALVISSTGKHFSAGMALETFANPGFAPDDAHPKAAPHSPKCCGHAGHTHPH
jgi:hypothetical protein